MRGFLPQKVYKSVCINRIVRKESQKKGRDKASLAETIGIPGTFRIHSVIFPEM